MTIKDVHTDLLVLLVQVLNDEMIVDKRLVLADDHFVGFVCFAMLLDPMPDKKKDHKVRQFELARETVMVSWRSHKVLKGGHLLESMDNVARCQDEQTGQNSQRIQSNHLCNREMRSCSAEIAKMAS